MEIYAGYEGCSLEIFACWKVEGTAAEWQQKKNHAKHRFARWRVDGNDADFCDSIRSLMVELRIEGEKLGWIDWCCVKDQ